MKHFNLNYNNEFYWLNNLNLIKKYIIEPKNRKILINSKNTLNYYLNYLFNFILSINYFKNIKIKKHSYLRDSNDTHPTGNTTDDDNNNSTDTILSVLIVFTLCVIAIAILRIITKCKEKHNNNKEEELNPSISFGPMKLSQLDTFQENNIPLSVQVKIKKLRIKPIKLHLPHINPTIGVNSHEFISSSTIPDFSKQAKRPSPLIYVNIRKVSHEHIDFTSKNGIHVPLITTHFQMCFDNR